MVYSAGLCHLSERAPEAQEQEPDPIEEVGRQAGQILGDSAGTYQHRTEDSSQPVPLEGEITFIPEMAGVEFNPKRFSFLFQESVNRAEFRLRAANKLEGQVARGRMTVFLDSIIVAEIGLSIHVDSSRSSAAKEFVRVEQHRYRKIFAAYSNKDRVVVEALERYGKRLVMNTPGTVVHCGLVRFGTRDY